MKRIYNYYEFDDIQAVKDFAGENYEQAVVPEAARKF